MEGQVRCMNTINLIVFYLKISSIVIAEILQSLESLDDSVRNVETGYIVVEKVE